MDCGLDIIVSILNILIFIMIFWLGKKMYSFKKYIPKYLGIKAYNISNFSKWIRKNEYIHI